MYVYIYIYRSFVLEELLPALNEAQRDRSEKVRRN